MTILQDVCHHTTRLKDIGGPLAQDISILNQSWKRICEGNPHLNFGTTSKDLTQMKAGNLSSMQ